MEEKDRSIMSEEDYQKGIEYLYGTKDTEQNRRKAFQYFNKAALGNHDEAKFQLGKLYIFGEPFIMKNYKKLINTFKKQRKVE